MPDDGNNNTKKLQLMFTYPTCAFDFFYDVKKYCDKFGIFSTTENEYVTFFINLDDEMFEAHKSYLELAKYWYEKGWNEATR